MAFRSMLMGAAVLGATGIAGAQAQSPFPPPGASPFPPAGATMIPPGGAGGAGGGFGPPAPQQQQTPPCLQKFTPLRDEMEKRFGVAKAAIARKPSNAADVCAALTKFSQAQVAAMKFIQQNTDPYTCPFPPGSADNLKASNQQTEDVRKRACAAADAPKARPSEPSLNDVLSPPAYGKNNTKTGSGTLDSLYGNPLAR